MKICVYTIAKNEEHHVERLCNSAKDADLILILDTGSTDNTVKVARMRRRGSRTEDLPMALRRGP